MKKENSIIIGSGVIGSYLAKLLISKKRRVIVTSRKTKRSYTNYNKLNIENKIIFEELDVLKKTNILKLLKKYTPKNINKFPLNIYHLYILLLIFSPPLPTFPLSRFIFHVS